MNTRANISVIVRYAIRILIILACTGILYSLLYPLLFADTSKLEASFSDADRDPVIGLIVTEWSQAIAGADNEKPGNAAGVLNLSPEQRELVDRFSIPLMIISLDYIYLPPLTISDTDRFCVQELSVLGEIKGLEDFELFRNSQKLLVDNTGQACFQAGLNYVVIDTVAVRPMLPRNRNLGEYLYPFDDRLLGFEVLLKGYVEKKDGTTESVSNIDVRINLSHTRWVETTTSEEFRVDGFVAKELQVTLKRSWVYRTLFFIIPIIALVALVSLIALENLGSFWEVSIAMLGLWSIREILIPNYINSPTIVDQTLTFMYILLLLVVIASLAAKFRDKGVVDLALLIPIRKGIATLVRWGEDQIDRGWASNEEIAKSFLVRADLVSSASIKEKLRRVAEIFINRSGSE